MGLNPSERSITMSIPTFIALISLLAAGIFAAGITQADISTLKRDVSSQSTQIDRMSEKIDKLTTLVYDERRERRNAQ